MDQCKFRCALISSIISDQLNNGPVPGWPDWYRQSGFRRRFHRFPFFRASLWSPQVRPRQQHNCKSSSDTNITACPSCRSTRRTYPRSGDGIISTYSILDNTGRGSAPQPFPRDIRNNTHTLQTVLQRHPLPPPTPPLPIRPKGSRGRGRGRSRAPVGRGKLQQQSLLRQQPPPNPAKTLMGASPVLPPALLRLQKALDLEPYVRYVESLTVVDQKT